MPQTNSIKLLFLCHAVSVSDALSFGNTERNLKSNDKCNPDASVYLGGWNPFGGSGSCSIFQHCCPDVRHYRMKDAKGTCYSLRTRCSSVGTVLKNASDLEEAQQCDAGDLFAWRPMGHEKGKCVGKYRCCPLVKGDRSKNSEGVCVTFGKSCDDIATKPNNATETKPKNATETDNRMNSSKSKNNGGGALRSSGRKLASAKKCFPGDWISWSPFGGKNLCSFTKHCCPDVRGNRTKGALGTCYPMTTKCSKVGKSPTASDSRTLSSAKKCFPGNWISWSPFGGKNLCSFTKHCCPDVRGNRTKGALGTCYPMTKKCSKVGKPPNQEQPSSISSTTAD